jgi:hypothetical protein
MLEVILTCPTPEGSREIALEEGKVSFGRSDEADYRLGDSGLSRLHATVYRDGDDVWIVDENSTNGSFVNGEKVSSRGTVLRNGDRIKIGNETILAVKIADPQTARPETGATAPGRTVASAPGEPGGFPLVATLAITAFALLIIGTSAIFIGVKVFGNNPEPEFVEDPPYEYETPDNSNKDNKNTKKSPTPAPSAEITTVDPGNTETVDNKTIETKNDGTTVVLPKGKYQDMSDADKDRYIAVKAEKIARQIGNQKADAIPPEAVKSIKEYINGYASRLGKAKRDSCDQGSWIASDFTSVLTRATKTSPMVIRNFRAEGIEPQIGIYVAMIEGEHCPCLTSNTGAKGMFQFLASSAPDYGLAAEDRCDPDKSAKAGAKYLKSLITRYGTAPDSVPLAIASFNSGQGNLSQNLDKVLSETAGQNRSFWTLAANKNLMQGRSGEQFKGENIKYVPKFFATAIIGENPQDFGVGLQPLSTYAK